MSRYTGSSEQRRLREMLRRIPTEAHLRQDDLARILNQSQSFVSKDESGERRLDLLELQQICNAVSVFLEEFARRFEGSVNETKQTVPKPTKTLLSKGQKL